MSQPRESVDRQEQSTLGKQPAFMRRYTAAETSDPDTLVSLACDDSYYVRRQAVQNPATPDWILDLLTRAGATPDLRGKSQPDPTLDSASLRRLVEGGPWARQLVAEHPNTGAEVLDVLKDQPSIPLRLAVARHLNTPSPALSALCCDGEEQIRAAAAANPQCPPDILVLLATAGADPDLSAARRPRKELSPEQLGFLGALGPWGRYLASRNPTCPPDLLEEVARDYDWRVRSGVLDNPNVPTSLLARLLDTDDEDVIKSARALSWPSPSLDTLARMARHPNPEVRMAVARHPAVPAEMLGWLAADGTREVRAFVVANPNLNPDDLALLVRAGSSADLMGLCKPDLTMTAVELEALCQGGQWARQLGVCHPNTGPEMLARLLCDDDSKIREWAKVHPNAPQDVIRELMRAGSSADFQGFITPDLEMKPEGLRRLSEYGPWAQWVVAHHPNAPPDLIK